MIRILVKCTSDAPVIKKPFIMPNCSVVHVTFLPYHDPYLFKMMHGTCPTNGQPVKMQVFNLKMRIDRAVVENNS